MDRWISLFMLAACFTTAFTQELPATVRSVSPEQMRSDLAALRRMTEGTKGDYEFMRDVYLAYYNGTAADEISGGFILINNGNTPPPLNWPSITKDEYYNVVLGYGKPSTVKKTWITPTCCVRWQGTYPFGFHVRRALYLPGRTYACYLKIKCWSNFCEGCVDSFKGCSPSLCHHPISYQHCRKTCGFCQGPTTSTTPATTTKPPPQLIEVKVYVNKIFRPYDYSFVTSSEHPPLPWKLASCSLKPGEVVSFKMFNKPNGKYEMPVSFCKAEMGFMYKWMVTKGNCRKGWHLDFRLFASMEPVESGRKLYISNRGKGPWTSRISEGEPCCDYVTATCVMYVPE